MRHTGKLYSLTLVSCGLTVVAATMVAFWNENSSWIHLWFDIVPQGLGMASVITTTLIVRACLPLIEHSSEVTDLKLTTYRLLCQAMIANVGREDRAVATGSTFAFPTFGS